MYVPDLEPICNLDLNTVLFEIKYPYRCAKNLLQAHKFYRLIYRFFACL